MSARAARDSATGTSPMLRAMLAIGFVFLYAPILSLIV